MRKIITLSFLLCIPIFIAAQTFKVVDFQSTGFGDTDDEYKALALRSKYFMKINEKSINISLTDEPQVIITLHKVRKNYFESRAIRENGRYLIFKLALSTASSYITSAFLTTDIISKSQKASTTIKLERM